MYIVLRPGDDGFDCFNTMPEAEAFIISMMNGERQLKETDFRVFDAEEIYIGQKTLVSSIQLTRDKPLHLVEKVPVTVPLVTKDELIAEIGRIKRMEMEVRSKLDSLG